VFCKHTTFVRMIQQANGKVDVVFMHNIYTRMKKGQYVLGSASGT
jgi:hypothetical protein